MGQKEPWQSALPLGGADWPATGGGAAAMGLGSAISSWRPSRARPSHAGVELATLATLRAYFLAGASARLCANAPAPGAEQAVGNLRQIV